MNFDIPKVFHLASTRVLDGKTGLSKYLDHLGASDWTTDAQGGAELLIEIAGRRCYKSFGTGLNPNITRVREGNHDYIGNILKSQHGSVLEHAYDTFAFENVSRVFTHELVRHRLCNFSQESMRFVRPTDLSTIFPEVYTEHLTPIQAGRVRAIFQKTFEDIEDIQRELVEICGMDNPELGFPIKKLFQSANRRLIPDGVLTGIIVTANHRTWRHIIEMRTSLHAEEEIRYVMVEVAEILSKEYPAIYQDMVVGAGCEVYDKFVPEIAFTNRKI
jgi:thymidylate synthase (FAD)